MVTNDYNRAHSSYASAIEAATILQRHGFEAYIIGGAVRDLWLGHIPKDFDLTTNATPQQIMHIPEFEHAHYKDTAQAYGVTRVHFTHQNNPNHLEIATFRKDIGAHRGRRATTVIFASLEDDVHRRDFTINALAYDTGTSFIIDYTDGIDDLTHKLIRFIGDPLARIHEDPLRLLRAIRFKNQLGFSYHPSAAAAMRVAVAEGAVEAIAVERLRNELTTMLVHPSRPAAMQDLDTFGILERVLPEVTAGKGVSQPPEFHIEGDVWRHQLLAIEYLPPHPSKQLVWATLLHDTGKAPTSREPYVPHARIRFDRHYAVGAELTKTALQRLHFSARDVRDITWMVYHHMSIDDLPHMRPSHQQRMLGHPAFADLLELHRADAAASWRPGQPHGKKPAFRAIERLWQQYRASPPERQQPSLKRDLGIDGNWLLARFGHEYKLAHNPATGNVLQALNDWYRDKGVTDKKAYLSQARTLLKQYHVPKISS